MASEATPRINARYLDSFTNQTVRILGKVTALRGDTATIDANGSVNVQLNRVSQATQFFCWFESAINPLDKRMLRSPGLAQQDAHLQMGNAAEIVGKVQSDLTIKVYQAVDFGGNIGEC